MKQLLIAASILLPAWSAAAAADDGLFRVRVGAGAQMRPEFIGADKSSLAPLFNFKVARGTKEFSFGAPDDSPSIAVVSSKGFSFGPAVNVEGRRKESDLGAPVGSVARTFEVGAFAQYLAADSFRLRAEARKGINGHEGIVGSLGADKIWRSGDRYVFSVGPRILFSDARFQRAYFGVTPAASVASGLPAYRPWGGIYGVAAASGMSYQLGTGPWGLFGYARYERLVGDAAKSPIIRELGSRNHFSGGIGLNYTFSIRAY
ncbi:MAG: MipA/OmpV family protein [Bacillota bacterium]